MQIVSYSQARNSLKSVIDKAIEDSDAIVIHRRDGADAVLMSLAQYESMTETLHLLSSPANAAHLLKGIAQDKAGLARQRELIRE